MTKMINRLLIIVLSLMTVTTLVAGEIQQFEIEREGDAYVVTTQVIINAPVGAVRDVLTNYPELHRINNSVKSVKIVSEKPEEGLTRIQSEIHMCALFFCMNLQQVQDMVDVKPGDLRAFIIAEQSDFASGRSYWRSQAVADNPEATELQWVAVLIPDFWVPPAIGPWVIKSKLEEEALETIDGIESVIASQQDASGAGANIVSP